MFNLERQASGTQAIVATEAQELKAEQMQRDVFETHRHRVFSVSYYMTANEAEAEGILTDTFVQAFAATPKPDAEGVDRAMLAELERRFSLAPTAAAVPEKGMEMHRGQVRRTDLEEAVATLPSRERLIFLLRDVEGYDAGRIGGLLGCDEASVQKALISARIRMRNELARMRLRAAAAQMSQSNTDQAQSA